jgi:hypothetical protein
MTNGFILLKRKEFLEKRTNCANKQTGNPIAAEPAPRPSSASDRGSAASSGGNE